MGRKSVHHGTAPAPRRGIARLIALLALAPLCPGVASAQWDQPEPAYVSPEMVLVPGGTFTMGTSMLSDEEKPQHQVTISPFYICAHEVTIAEFKVYIYNYFLTYVDLKRNGNVWNGQKWLTDPKANWEKPGFDQTDAQPVVLITWEDAAAYCNFLSQKEGLDDVYVLDERKEYKADFSKNGYRLPTEAEWEFADGGGQLPQKSKTRYIGSNRPDTVAWYSSNAEGATHPVATKQPNQLGLYDMGGNVAEWCGDWYGLYTSDTATDPHGPDTGKEKVIRGGSFLAGIDALMAQYRDKAGRYSAWNDTGFRVARNMPPPMPKPLGSMELIHVDGGTYKNTILRDFYIGKYEVDNAEFAAFVTATGYATTAETGGGGYIYDASSKSWVKKPDATWKNPYITTTSATPVVEMSYYDAAEFCNWLSDLEGLPHAYTKKGNAYAIDFNAKGYRLPTELEWEWAAKGGTQSKGYKYAGSEDPAKVAYSMAQSATGPHAGGFLAPNELGIYDMCGNVWEWCADLLPQTDKPGIYKAPVRGGAWRYKAESCTIEWRNVDYLEGTDFTFGFRVMRPE